MQPNRNGYSHLLSGAAPGLECAGCLHVDDIGEPVGLDELADRAVAIFDRLGEKPTRVSYRAASDSRARRAHPATFRQKMVGKGHAVGTTLHDVTWTTRGFEGDGISDTWTPRAVVSVARHGRVLEAFVQSPRASDAGSGFLLGLAEEMFGRSFAASYVFEYPLAFSPSAYCTGISYDPNSKAVGSVAPRDSDRVANWANHCYRGRRASEGYLRDIYAVTDLSERHLERRVGARTLRDWILSSEKRGSLAACGTKWRWTVDGPHLGAVQAALDEAKILLAGFPPD